MPAAAAMSSIDTSSNGRSLKTSSPARNSYARRASLLRRRRGRAVATGLTVLPDQAGSDASELAHPHHVDRLIGIVYQCSTGGRTHRKQGAGECVVLLSPPSWRPRPSGRLPVLPALTQWSPPAV